MPWHPAKLNGLEGVAVSMNPSLFFDLTDYGHGPLFAEDQPVWQALSGLKAYMDAQPYPTCFAALATAGPLARTMVLHHDTLFDAAECAIEFNDATKGKLRVLRQGVLLDGASVLMAGAVLVGARFRIGRGVLVESGAFLKEPAILGDQTEVRQGAYLRGYCLVGKRCVVGHTTEVKHSILLDDAKAGHFAYLGDSILGNHVNLGAGTKLANLRFQSGEVEVKTANGPLATGLKKLGAIFGDRCQTGCNSVTNPGTLLGKKCVLMPTTTAPSGYHPASTLLR
jgi:acetyltransferase-like isoleucine patch superfamily enzyme